MAHSETTALVPTPDLLIGHERERGSAVALEPDSVLRHLMALGSSGSGKTVFCKIVVEECVRRGIPAICIDPQGDLCSLAMMAKDPEALVAKGVDPACAREFAERVDPVVFTPASRKGVPVCADPFQGDLAVLDERERMHAATGIASMLVSLLGYELDSDDGNGLVAVFDRALHDRLAEGRPPSSLKEFSSWFQGLDEVGLEPYWKYLEKSKLSQAARRLARLEVGARGLLFHLGLPLDIDVLLGRPGSPGEDSERTRLSIVYLNSLHSQEDKEFFVAALVERLYQWMLRNPSRSPQALFYIDEVAPFIPPTRKPACKPSLSLLFKQARKYGIGCLMATQNPGDVDYKAMSQFGSWALGRITTRQDMKKVQPVVKSLDPVRADRIMEVLPSQQAGEFTLISPDNFDRSLSIRTRWLYSRHETLDQDGIEQLSREGGWQQRFVVAPEKPEEAREAGRVGPPPLPASRPPKQSGEGEIADSPPRKAESSEALNALARFASVSAAEFGRALGVSEGTARSRLRRLVESGGAMSYKAGRTTRYWTRESGYRPDLGLSEKVRAIQAEIDEQRVVELANDQAEKRLLGIFGTAEELDHVGLEHRRTQRLLFSERIPRSALKRLFGRDFDEHIDSIYLHPGTLEILVFDPGRGISFHDRPDRYASRIRDFDGLTTSALVKPGRLTLRDTDWQTERTEREILQHFAERFEGQARGIEPVLVPVWNLHFRRADRGSLRVVTIDALSGRGVEWPNG